MLPPLVSTDAPWLWAGCPASSGARRYSVGCVQATTRSDDPCASREPCHPPAANPSSAGCAFVHDAPAPTWPSAQTFSPASRPASSPANDPPPASTLVATSSACRQPTGGAAYESACNSNRGWPAVPVLIS